MGRTLRVGLTIVARNEAERDTQPFQGWDVAAVPPRVGRKQRGQPWALLRDPLWGRKPVGGQPSTLAE